MRVLAVDDELSMREYLEVLLSRAGHDVIASGTVADAEAALARETIDLVITDMRLGTGSGMSVLRAARRLQNPPEVILITAFGTPSAAVEAMREGAYDYICKPFDNEELKLLVQKALEKRELRQENKVLKETLLGPDRRPLIGSSEAIKEIWRMVAKVGPSRSTVLVTGESGTGKELVARSIHLMSPRAKEPFVPINCAAISEGILESELFGHKRGSFTGALADRDGILVSAGEGTVFLDEVGEIAPPIQVKLLRILQERTVKAVGSSREQPFHARVLAATNKNLEQQVKLGLFREDLYYRLNVISIELPPIRQRPEDIPVLLEFFLSKMREELGRPGLHLSAESSRLLEKYPFPGNVRQLENMVERAATLSDGDLLGPELFPASVRGEQEALPGACPQLPEAFSLERFLDQSERQYLFAALQKANGVKTRAAELLGLSFRSFRYRLAKHGLSERDDDNDAAEP